MPAELIHEGTQESARSEAPQLILPSEHVQGNIRETKKFNNLGERSTKYNSQGVDFENPYNAFYQKAEKQEAVVELLAADYDKLQGELSDQGRRIKELEAKLAELEATRPDVTPVVPVIEAGADTSDVAGELESATTIEATETSEESESSDTPEGAVTPEALEASETEADAPELPPLPEQSAEDAAAERVENAERQFELTLTEEITQLQERADAAATRYAELTAKGRGGYNGHFFHNSKSEFLKKIFGKWNEKASEDLTESRKEYEKQVSALQKATFDALLEQHGEQSEAHAIMAANAAAIGADAKLEAAIMEARTENNPKAKAFMNWWVNHDGLGWKIVKYGVPGAVIGAAASLASVPILVGAGVAAAGAGAMAFVTNKHRANSEAEKGGPSYAEQNLAEDGQKKLNLRDELQGRGEMISATDLTGITEARTGSEKARNRRNVAVSAAVAFGGAKLAGVGADLLTSNADAAAGSGADTQVEQEQESGQEQEQEQEEEQAPAIVGNEFTVESGSSYTQELMDFAGANGHALTPDQSWQLHNELMQQFGADYIDINGAGADTYIDGGDVRLTEPGAAKWHDGVGQYVQQWMAARGLW